MSRTLQHSLGRSLVDPALELHWLLRFGRKDDVKILPPWAFDDVPAVAGTFGFVNDNRTDCAAPGRLLELVSPAPLIGHGLAAELVGNRLSGRSFEVGIVNQEQRHFAF